MGIIVNIYMQIYSNFEIYLQKTLSLNKYIIKLINCYLILTKISLNF